MRETAVLVSLFFWDYQRASWPYVALCAVLLAALFLAPAWWWGDPMALTP